MKAHLSLALVGLFALTGCIGDSDSSEGSISALTIAGLEYRTDSQSGVTGASGQFKYESGETITFSLHGLDLFTTTASSSLSIESLLGFALPKNQGALNEKLDSRRRHPDFHRQLNRLQVLALSDSDQDLSNGIDVSGIAQLDLSSIDLDDSVRDFYYQHLDTIAGNEAKISLQEIFKTLYTVVGVDVNAQLLTRKINDQGNDGIEDGYASYQYDATGYLIAFQKDWYNQNCIEDEYAITTNQAGEILHTEYDRRMNAQQVCAQRTFWQERYSEAGEQLGYARTSDFNVDGVLNSHYVSTSNFDEQGNRISEVIERSTDGDDVFDERSTYSYTYENGRQIKSEWVTGGMDGSIAKSAFFIFTYDEAGRIVKTLHETDNDNNPDTANIIAITDYVYDENGNQTLYDYQTFNNGSQTPSYRNVHSYTYDAKGNTLTRTYRNYNGSEIPSQDYGYTYTYNDAGQRTVLDYYWKENGELIQVRRTEYEYDAQGREIAETEWEDDRNDGDIEFDSMERYVYRYDDQGREVYEYYEEDYELDGVFDYFESSTYEFNADDQITKETYLEGERSIVNAGLENEAVVEIMSSKSESLYSYNQQGNRIKDLRYNYSLDGDTGNFLETPSNEDALLRTYEDTEYGIEFIIETYMDDQHPFYYRVN